MDHLSTTQRTPLPHSATMADEQEPRQVAQRLPMSESHSNGRAALARSTSSLMSPTEQHMRPSSMSVSDLLSRPSSSQGGRETQRSSDAKWTDSSNPAGQREGTPADYSFSRKRPQLSQSSSSTSLATPSLGRESFSSRRPITPMGGVELNASENVNAYQYAAVQQITENRENIEYILSVREQPKHSRMCGVGEKADRRPIDPAPIIQLRVIVHDHPCPSESQSVSQKSKQDTKETERGASSTVIPLGDARSGAVNAALGTHGGDHENRSMMRRGVPVRTEWGDGWEDKTWYLENPYYFMYAMLADAETDEELHLLGDRRTRYTTGSCVSCLYHLKDIDGTEQGFFVFPDLSIRVEGCYRLKLCLFETIGHEVHHCKSIYSQPFNVYTAKRFPGMEESTPLSKSFADQGLKVRVRKNPRARRARTIGGKRKGDSVGSDEESDSNGPVLIDRKEYAHSLGPNAANKRIRGEVLPGNEPFTTRGPVPAYPGHPDYPHPPQQSVSRPRPTAGYGYGGLPPPQHEGPDAVAYRAEWDRRAQHPGGPYAPPLLQGRPMHGNTGHPSDVMADRYATRTGPTPYSQNDRMLHEPHLRPSLESRRSEPFHPPAGRSDREDRGPQLAVDMHYHERMANVDRWGRGPNADGRPPVGMHPGDAERHHRGQAMQRPPPPPEILRIPTWASPRSASPIHTRAPMNNDHLRDRSISDPYRGAHSDFPNPGTDRPYAGEEQQQRLPPLRVALSPETTTRAAQAPTSDAMQYYPRSVNRPRAASPLQQRGGMPVRVSPSHSDGTPVNSHYGNAGTAGWEGTSSRNNLVPAPPPQQYYHQQTNQPPYPPPPSRHMTHPSKMSQPPYPPHGHDGAPQR